MKDNQIFKIYGTDYREMTKLLLEKSGLEERIGKRDARIAIKPNLVCPTPAEFGATTHPEVVAGIIEYLKERRFSDVSIVEGSWVGDKTEDAYEYCGYRALCEKYGVEFRDTQKMGSYAVDAAGMTLHISDAVKDLDFLIDVPVLKGHCQTKMTCALKNMKGLLPNSEKRRFHKLGLHGPIAHLSTVVKPDFIVVDHICGDPDFEEGGNPLVRNCVMAAVDPVLTDSYACRILGFSADDVPYVKMAEKLGSGCADLTRAEIVRFDRDVRADGERLTAVPESPDLGDGGSPFFKNEKTDGRTRHVLDVSYAVDEVDSCSACYGSLIPALTRLKEEGLLGDLHEQIAIGQGHRGKTGTLGVGNCTAKFDFCVSGCPPEEEKIYRELASYIRRGRDGGSS